MNKKMKDNIEKATHIVYHTVHSFARTVGTTKKTIYDLLGGKGMSEGTRAKIENAGFNADTFEQVKKPYIAKKGCEPDSGVKKS